MDRYIEWYLAELERRLAGSVSRERLHEILCDVENHLRERTEELERGGMGPREAQLAALEAFGRPERIVWAELAAQRARTLGTPTPVAQGLAALLAFLALGFLAIGSYGARLGDERWFLLAAACVPYLLVSGRAGRGYSLPLAWAAAAGFAVFLVASSLALVRHGDLSTRAMAKERVRLHREAARKADRLAEVLREGRREFFGATVPSEAPARWRLGSPDLDRVFIEVGASAVAWPSSAPATSAGRANQHSQAAPSTSRFLVAPLDFSVSFPWESPRWAPPASGWFVRMPDGEAGARYVVFTWFADFREARAKWMQSASAEAYARQFAEAERARATRIDASLARPVQFHGDLAASVAGGFAMLALLLGALGELFGRAASALRSRRAIGWA